MDAREQLRNMIEDGLLAEGISVAELARRVDRSEQYLRKCLRGAQNMGLDLAAECMTAVGREILISSRRLP